MKKMIRTTVAGLVAGLVLTASAAAANFENCADNLKDMALFRGTTAGYELDRAPTRAEAAVMLVRLLGKEEEAKKLTYTAPFTDLQGWEKPYVQYLYENKLANGVSTTEFASKEACSAKMYAAFLLRALGFSESEGDFAYRGAVSFAKEQGVYETLTVNETKFLRDHVAATSYTALSRKTKGAETSLLQQLVDEGAVEKEKADKYLKLFETYKKYTNAIKTSANSFATVTTASASDSAGTALFDWKSTGTVLLHSENETIDLNEIAEMQSKSKSKTIAQTEILLKNGVLYTIQDNVQTEEPITQRQQALAFTAVQQLPIAVIEELSYNGKTAEIKATNAALLQVDFLLKPFELAAGTFSAKKDSDILLVQNLKNGYIESQKINLSFEGTGIAGQLELTAKAQKMK